VEHWREPGSERSRDRRQPSAAPVLGAGDLPRRRINWNAWAIAGLISCGLWAAIFLLLS